MGKGKSAELAGATLQSVRWPTGAGVAQLAPPPCSIPRRPCSTAGSCSGRPVGVSHVGVCCKNKGVHHTLPVKS